jgi:hypothetical protein
MSRRWLLKLLDHGPFPAIVLALSLSHINVEQKRGLSSVERQIVRLPVSEQIQRGVAGYWEDISESMRVLRDKTPRTQFRLAGDPKLPIWQ